MRIDDFKFVLIGARDLVKENCSRGDIIIYFSRVGINITPYMLKDFLKNVDKVEDYNVVVNL